MASKMAARAIGDTAHCAGWINVLFNQQSGKFTSALAVKDADRFWRSIYQCVGMLVVAAPMYALYYFLRD